MPLGTMNFMQQQQSYGGVGQVPQTSAVGGHNFAHGPSPSGHIAGPPPHPQPPGPHPLGSGGIRLGPSSGIPLQNNGQIPQGSKLATYMRRQGYPQQSQTQPLQGSTLLGPPQGQSLHNATTMHGPPPPPHDNSERSHQGLSGTMPPNQVPAGSTDIGKNFSGLSLSSSSASLDGLGGVTSSSSSNSATNFTSTQLKKLSLSGIQEFVPSSSSNLSLFRSGSNHDAFNSRTGSNSSLNPPKSSAIISSGNSPRQSPTPGSSTAPLSHTQTSAASTLPSGATDLTAVGESGDGQALVNTTTSESTEINAYNAGGTMYFYSGDEIDPTMGMGNGVVNGTSVSSTVLSPNFTLFTGTPTYVANMRVRSNAPANLAENETKIEVLKRQQICLSQVNPEMHPEIPSQVDNFTNLCPLESTSANLLQKSHTFGYVTTVYKATNIKENQHVAMRRVQNFKLVNSKCMVLVEQWRKLSHSNLVKLRQVFTTKEFGDQSIIFVYDFYPGAETLMAKHFSNSSSLPGNPPFMDPYGYGNDGPRPPPYGAGGMHSTRNRGNVNNYMNQQNNGMLPEPLIWTYVVQLTSALRTIHQAGLACRTLDPTKIIVTNNARILLNCCGMFDVLTFDPTASNPMAAMAHYQQEDLIALGKIVLALACNSFMAIQRENLQTSMEIVTSTYSSDMRNLIMYLLTNPTRVKSVNDLMPMIGARFYDAIDESNARNDLLEADLAKDIESTRLFRLLTKLCTVVDRADLNGDASWSEYGDRYMLKLFRDYIFHQVLEDGRPWLDMAHVISCLNKFDAGVPDKICLMSRDEQNVLVVAYHDLKICLDQSYAECVQSAKCPPTNTAMTAAGSQSSAVSLGMASALSSTQYLG